MAEETFAALMTLLVPQVVAHICDHYPWDEITASRAFDTSRVYALLEQEDTKLWHLSPRALFAMFDEEQKTGGFAIPEET